MPQIEHHRFWRLSWLSLWLALWLAGLCLMACTSTSQPNAAGGETNWLTCEDDADCPSTADAQVCSGGYCRPLSDVDASMREPSACRTLPLASCAEQPGCETMTGRRMDDVDPCLHPAEPLACVPTERPGCTPGPNVYEGPQGDMYLIDSGPARDTPGACEPDGFVRVLIDTPTPVASYPACGTDTPGSCAAADCIVGTHCCDACDGALCVPDGVGCPTDCNYAPCAGKACGDGCSQCPPWDIGCTETAVVKACDPDGRCVSASAPMCPGGQTFPCGPMTLDCEPDEYCLEVLAGIQGGQNSYTCNARDGMTCDALGGAVQNGGCRVTLAAP